MVIGSGLAEGFSERPFGLIWVSDGMGVAVGIFSMRYSYACEVDGIGC